MRPQEIIERERRWATPAAIASALVVALLVAGLIVSQQVDLGAADTEAERLEAFDADSGTLLVAAILQAVAIALIAAPLLYLFRAAEARSERVRSALIGVVIAGPLFFGAAVLLQWVGVSSVASDFVAPGAELCTEGDMDEQDDCVENLVADDGTVSLASGLSLAGTIGLLAALVYTSLHAMRTGLLTRFFGSLGMALGVSILFLGPLGVVVYALALGLLFRDWWPGGRPPSWEAGKAIPWPRPGEEPPQEREEDAVEGEATELPDEARQPEASTEPRRKRKRRH